MRKFNYGWWVVIGAFILLLCTTGGRVYAFPVFFEEMLHDMGWSRAQIAGALSIGLLLSGSVTPVIGMLIHRIGVRKIMLSGSLIAFTGYFLLSTVTEIWQFYFYYGVIVAIGSACISIVPNMTAVEGLFTQKKSTALGIASTGVGAGGAIMAPLAGKLIALYGWQTAFLYLADIIALVGIPVSFFIMRTPDEKNNSSINKILQDNLPELTGASLR
jgi:MFS family permease